MLPLLSHSEDFPWSLNGHGQRVSKFMMRTQQQCRPTKSRTVRWKNYEHLHFLLITGSIGSLLVTPLVFVFSRHVSNTGTQKRWHANAQAAISFETIPPSYRPQRAHHAFASIRYHHTPPQKIQSTTSQPSTESAHISPSPQRPTTRSNYP